MDDNRPQPGYRETDSNRHVQLWWIAAGALGSTMLGFLEVLDRLYPDLFSMYVGPLGLMLIPLFGPGLLVGAAQWVVLRRWLRVPHPFVLVWMLGSAMGFVVELGSAFIWESNPWDPAIVYAGQGELAAIVGLIMGLVQYVALRGRLRRAPLWILISAVGWGVGWPLASLIGDSMWGTRYGEALGFLGIGMVTSVPLPWLAR